MSILTWLKEAATGDTKLGLVDTDSMTFAKGEERFLGLDMKAALDAHMAWEKRLESRLNGDLQEELNVDTVASDCECTLGKWLYGSAKAQFGNIPDYDELRKIHAEYHLKAGEILKNVLNGERESARKNLKELRYQSGNVQLALVRFYAHAQH